MVHAILASVKHFVMLLFLFEFRVFYEHFNSLFLRRQIESYRHSVLFPIHQRGSVSILAIWHNANASQGHLQACEVAEIDEKRGHDQLSSSHEGNIVLFTCAMLLIRR